MLGEIDRYWLERELGAGGFGTVYLARHKILNTSCAVKLLKSEHSSDPAHLERFLNEARGAASIGNPHIVRVTDAGVVSWPTGPVAGATPQKQAFLAMELLDGEDLSAYLVRRQRLTPAEGVYLMRQVLNGLSAAHSAGIVHRDLKPANVFIARSATGPFVKLLDFGISKIPRSPHHSELTVTGLIIGTPQYMAPEQLIASRDVDARADLYSAGVLLYQMLSGRLPFEAESFAELSRDVLTTPAPPLASVVGDIPPGLASAVERALERDRERRWESAAAFDDALARSLTIPPTMGYAFVSDIADREAKPSGTQDGWEHSSRSRHTPMKPSAGSLSDAQQHRVHSEHTAWSPRMIALAAGLIGLAFLSGSICVLVVASQFRLLGVGQFEGAPGLSPSAPVYDGHEAIVGDAGLLFSRSTRRAAADGRWIVTVPINIRAAGEAGLVIQRADFSAEGYSLTAESELSSWTSMVHGVETEGSLVWRARAPGPAPIEIILRYRDWAARIPVE